MENLALNLNGLTGNHFYAQIARRVYESTADGFASENALAGAIPTEIGQLAQLVRLDLQNNQLAGASKNSLDCNFGIRVYRKLKNDLLAAQATFRRSSSGARL